MEIPEILGLFYLNLQGLEHGSNGQALEEHYQVCKIYEIPHPDINDLEVKTNLVKMEDLGIILQEEEREKLQTIQAISQKKPPIIVIDGVIFQINQGKLAGVWSSILEHWSQLERYDYQYERNGVANLFMFFEPLTGWRHTS